MLYAVTESPVEVVWLAVRGSDKFDSRPCTAGLVVLSSWMEDRLWATIPSRYVTSVL